MSYLKDEVTHFFKEKNNFHIYLKDKLPFEITLILRVKVMINILHLSNGICILTTVPQRFLLRIHRPESFPKATRRRLCVLLNPIWLY